MTFKTDEELKAQIERADNLLAKIKRRLACINAQTKLIGSMIKEVNKNISFEYHDRVRDEKDD